MNISLYQYVLEINDLFGEQVVYLNIYMLVVSNV